MPFPAARLAVRTRGTGFPAIENVALISECRNRRGHQEKLRKTHPVHEMLIYPLSSGQIKGQEEAKI